MNGQEPDNLQRKEGSASSLNDHRSYHSQQSDALDFSTKKRRNDYVDQQKKEPELLTVQRNLNPTKTYTNGDTLSETSVLSVGDQSLHWLLGLKHQISQQCLVIKPMITRSTSSSGGDFHHHNGQR